MLVSQQFELPLGYKQILTPIQNGEENYSIIMITGNTLQKLELLTQTTQKLGYFEFIKCFYLQSDFILLCEKDKYTVKKIHLTGIEEKCAFNYSSQGIIGQQRFEILVNEYNQFTLFQLSKQQYEQEQNILFTLNLVTIDLKIMAITQLKTIGFQASVRCLIMNPISVNSCFLMNPNSQTNKKIQFIIWSDSTSKDKVQVKESKQEIRGTVVNVLSTQQQIIFVYNSNGVESQFITYYNLENENEQNEKLDFGRKYQFRDAQIQGNIILFSCNSLFEDFYVVYNAFQKQIVRQHHSLGLNILYDKQLILTIDEDKKYLDASLDAQQSRLWITFYI